MKTYNFVTLLSINSKQSFCLTIFLIKSFNHIYITHYDITKVILKYNILYLTDIIFKALLSRRGIAPK